MPSSSQIRTAYPVDGAACAEIYRPYVESTAITFELEVPTADEMTVRIMESQQLHEWIVLEIDDRVVGYAYAHAFNTRAAYQWSAETSIYIDRSHHRVGGGRALYRELLARLTTRGYRRAFAGITQPNEKSTGFHRSFGFEHSALFRRVGYKHDSWHDVAWFQLDLIGDSESASSPPPIT